MTVENVKRHITRNRGLLIALGAFIVTFILWQLPYLLREPRLGVVVYPFRLFVTLIHELGHGTAASLSGGEFVSLQVMGSGAGLATTRGGERFIVIQMGYLGATLFGAAMLFLANRLRDPRFITGAVGVLCGGIPILIGADLGTRLVGLVVLAVFALIAWKTPPGVNIFILNVLAMMVGLNAFMDIWFLLSSLNATLGGVPNDALAMERLTYIPAMVWALLWVAISVVVLGGAFYLTFIRPLRRGANRTGG